MSSETTSILEKNKKYEYYKSPVYYDYIFIYLLSFPFFLVLFNMYILDFYFVNKVIVIKFIEGVMIHMPLWLIIDGIFGVTFFILFFVYYNLQFYEELFSAKFFKIFFSVFLIYSLFMTSWTVVGWIMFYRYPSIEKTKTNFFHIKTWIHLIIQSIFYLFFVCKSVYSLLF